MKLVDMKRSQAEQKAEEKATAPSSMVTEPYPWGLRLNLGEEEVSKLGLDLPEVGAEFDVVAVARVLSVSSHEESDGRRRSVELQLVKVALEPSKPSLNAARVLYPET